MEASVVTLSNTETNVPSSTALAIDRTRMAYERTTMAWIRTSVSLISFGFSIYKFFDLFRKAEGAVPTKALIGPRGFALLMIGTGLFTLIAAVLERWRANRTMPRGDKTQFSLANVVAALVAMTGVLTFVVVILRQ